MGFLSFFGPSVADLSCPVRLPFRSPTARFAAVALSSPTALTYTKYLPTPMAGYFLQLYPGIFFDMPSSGLSNSRKML
jgi:hypothetical protein